MVLYLVEKKLMCGRYQNILPLDILAAFSCVRKVRQRGSPVRFLVKTLIWEGEHHPTPFLSSLLTLQVSYMILQRVSPVTHSIGNCLKRVIVIVASVIFFQNPVSRQNIIGKFNH